MHLLISLLWSLSLVGAAEPAPTESRFFETSVVGVTLGSDVSGRQFVTMSGKGKKRDDGYIHFEYTNSTGTEILDLIRYPGGTKYAFYEIEVRALAAGAGGKLPRIAVPSFVSGKGIRLGLTRRALIDLIGEPSAEHRLRGRDTLKYTCSNATRCPTLKTVNMPSYEGRYVFSGDRLIEFSIGYPYP